MAWSAIVVPITGQLITAGFWQAQLSDNITILKTSIDDNGHLSYAQNFQTGNYTITLTDDVILANAGSVPITMTLPPVPAFQKRYEIKKHDLGANPVTILPNGAQQIDFAASFTLEVPMQSVTLQGLYTSAWWVL